MQFFYKFGNIKKQKQKPLKTEAFGSRNLKFQSIDGLLESRKSEVIGSTIVKCVQKKYFSYIIGKFVSLGRNFSKALVIMSWFLLLFLLLFLLIVYISFAFHLVIFQSELNRTSIVWIYKYLVIPWYFNIEQVVWEPIGYLKIFLICVKWAK